MKEYPQLLGRNILFPLFPVFCLIGFVKLEKYDTGLQFQRLCFAGISLIFEVLLMTKKKNPGILKNKKNQKTLAGKIKHDDYRRPLFREVFAKVISDWCDSVR